MTNQTATAEVRSNDGLGGTPGPYKATEFRCGDGTMCPGVMSESTGSAVAWASGRSDMEAYENARAIAAALSRLEREIEARREAQRENEALKTRLARARLELQREMREQGWVPPNV